MSVAIAPGMSTIAYQAVAIPQEAAVETPARELMAYTLAPSALDRSLRFYLGPKDFAVLAGVDRDLVRAIDFGMFRIIVVPLLQTLNWIHGYVGNYGGSIVILTLIINMLMFPLRHKQRRVDAEDAGDSARGESDSGALLQAKATDPAKQKMNQEMMALYRERGVNPASGCVPMLLTLPVFFAFYALLYTAIELRGAPFVGWIHDLSQPDPYYITPVLMVVTQVLAAVDDAGGRHRSDAAEDDAVHAASSSGSSSLPCRPASLIYWVVSNIWGIGQQCVTNYLIGPPNIRSPRPAGGAASEACRRRQDRSARRRAEVAEATQPIVEFLNRFTAALGIQTPVDVEETPDGPAAQSFGRRRRDCSSAIAASRIKALQHVVDMAFGRARGRRARVFVDALAYRKGKDVELRQMAKFLAEKTKQTGVDQQLGPLNPYERRIVHMAVAEVPGSPPRASATRFRRPSISLRK